MLSLLGRGGYGEVFLCRHRESGEVVALKRMKKSVFINKNEVRTISRQTFNDDNDELTTSCVVMVPSRCRA